jgi:hypothetical protein
MLSPASALRDAVAVLEFRVVNRSRREGERKRHFPTTPHNVNYDNVDEF